MCDQENKRFTTSPSLLPSREKTASVQFDPGPCSSNQSNGLGMKEKNKRNPTVNIGETRLMREEITDSGGKRGRREKVKNQKARGLRKV